MKKNSILSIIIFISIFSSIFSASEVPDYDEYAFSISWMSMIII